MAAGNLSDVPANDTYVGGNFIIEWFEAGDSAHKCGEVVEAEASGNAGEVIVCSVDGIPFAVTGLQADLDIDTDVTEGLPYMYYLLHAGTVLRIPHDATTETGIRGEGCIRSDAIGGAVEKGTTAGAVVGYLVRDDTTCADSWVVLIT